MPWQHFYSCETDYINKNQRGIRMKFVNDSSHFAGDDPDACGNSETEAILAKAIRDAVNSYCERQKTTRKI